jgi:hypothetical protein
MKRTLLSIATVLIGLFTTFSYIPVFAANDCVDTSILGGGQVCDNGSGDSIINNILIPVMDILTVGIGIIGAIGITIVGVQYMTAGDNEEQTRKAKRRMFEIIIGIAVYVLAYALLKWLLPGFN